MVDGHDSRASRFYEALRQESVRGPGHGFGRVARLVRSGAKLAATVVARGGREQEFALTQHELHSMEVLATRLGELKGLPMKFGQICSYLDLQLPEEARRVLRLLQTQSPATPF